MDRGRRCTLRTGTPFGRPKNAQRPRSKCWTTCGAFAWCAQFCAVYVRARLSPGAYGDFGMGPGQRSMGRVNMVGFKIRVSGRVPHTVYVPLLPQQDTCLCCTPKWPVLRGPSSCQVRIDALSSIAFALWRAALHTIQRMTTATSSARSIPGLTPEVRASRHR